MTFNHCSIIFITFTILFILLNYDYACSNDEITRNITQYKINSELHLLNKITTHLERITTKIGVINYSGNLAFIVQDCWSPGEFDLDEDKALVKIWEIKEKKELIFYGWIFSKSMSASILQHPIYNISLIKCY